MTLDPAPQPDATTTACRNCKGEGRLPAFPDSGRGPMMTCPICNGTRVADATPTPGLDAERIAELKYDLEIVERRRSLYTDRIKVAVNALLAENERLTKENGGEGLGGLVECLWMVRDFLKHQKCECTIGAGHDGPPMMYPEWIACVMRQYAKDKNATLVAELTTKEEEIHDKLDAIAKQDAHHEEHHQREESLLARVKELTEGLERIAARSRRIIDGEISTGVVGHANYCVSAAAVLLAPKESTNG